ncbi:hypothetical protein KIPB_004679 [Kipferlia bialata]|uniref:Transcription factor CBF/NF-Y/archaeal histone domain-containing protein n=1 Tax=Kipferlia bialata TaxID=797122 RepID=A0A9K3CUF1_9EUKA|nr:hypothetical protein KIPB_004679 [Kipferlia bialata]|eukprot:g4679.t1
MPRQKDVEPYLPVANVGKLMKASVDSNVKVARDSKQLVQECLSEFIMFMTYRANQICLESGRKTISGGDIVRSSASLGFDSYTPYLSAYGQRTVQLRKKVKLDKVAPPEPPVTLDVSPQALARVYPHDVTAIPGCPPEMPVHSQLVQNMALAPPPAASVSERLYPRRQSPSGDSVDRSGSSSSQ